MKMAISIKSVTQQFQSYHAFDRFEQKSTGSIKIFGDKLKFYPLKFLLSIQYFSIILLFLHLTIH